MTSRKQLHLYVDQKTIHVLNRITKDHDLKSLGNAADYIVKQWESNKSGNPNDTSEEFIERVACRVVEMLKDA